MTGALFADFRDMGDTQGFARGILMWFVLSIPSTYTNAMVRSFFLSL